MDRVFTLKGIGTVVTGTLWSGSICTEDTLRLMPDDLTCRARTVQVHDHSVECAGAGYRVAINLSGIDKDRLERGQMVLKGEGLTTTYMVDARLTLLPAAPSALKYGAQVRFHHGTADATAKLMFADRDRLAQGESCYAQVRLKTKILPAKGDRFIIRSLSPVTTIGGGVVIDPHPRKHGKGVEQVHRLEVLEKGSPTEVVTLLLDEASPEGLTYKELKARGLLAEEPLTAALADRSIATPRNGAGGELFFSPRAVADFELRLAAALEVRQRSNPADPSLTADELAKSVKVIAGDRSFQALLAGLLDSGLVTTKDQRYSMASAVARLSEEQLKLMEDIASGLAEAALSPPSLGDLAAALGARTGNQNFKLLLKLLVEDERAVKVKPDLYYAAEPVAIAREAVVARCQNQGRITLAEFRDLLDISRKFAQALLEYFDRIGLTRREGDYRVLRKQAGG